MRKLLLGTTAVAAAALFGAHDASAQTAPTVRIGGYFGTAWFNVQDTADKAAVVANPAAGQPANATRTFGRDQNDFYTDFEIQVFVTGKAANGLVYGATMELQMDNVGAGSPGTTLDVDEAYAFVSTPTLGTIRFGDEDSAANLLQVRAPMIAGMGSDGVWDEGLRPSSSGLRATNGSSPSLLTAINDGSDSSKIIYLSPQFYGFDAGVSYAPNAGEGERYYLGTAFQPTGPAAAQGAVGQRDRTTTRNEVSYGLRYRGTFSGVGIAAGFGGMFMDPATIGAVTGGAAQTTGTALNNLRQITAYTVGLNLSAYGFTVGGEYTWGNYALQSVGRTALPRTLNGSSHYVVSATYTTGALAFGAFYGQGEQDNPTLANGASPGNRTQSIYGIGAAYTVAPGMDLIANYTWMDDKNDPFNIAPVGSTFTSTSREAQVLVVGTRLAF
ncbi:porin [Humitalea sp. 24SJ18S-53]|uniref:porin n=1 Tax=Humitalea sp. 24SJ18S-53 TaxID=3422307 RepID=UPI003D677384